MKDELSPTGRSVYILRDALKSYLSVIEIGDGFYKVFEGSS